MRMSNDWSFESAELPSEDLPSCSGLVATPCRGANRKSLATTLPPPFGMHKRYPRARARPLVTGVFPGRATRTTTKDEVLPRGKYPLIAPPIPSVSRGHQPPSRRRAIEACNQILLRGRPVEPALGPHWCDANNLPLCSSSALCLPHGLARLARPWPRPRTRSCGPAA